MYKRKHIHICTYTFRCKHGKERVIDYCRFSSRHGLGGNEWSWILGGLICSDNWFAGVIYDYLELHSDEVGLPRPTKTEY